MPEKPEISIITVDGTTYIGSVDTEDGVITVTNTVAVSAPNGITTAHLATYLNQFLLEELTAEIVLGGNVSYVTSALSPAMQVEFDILWLRLQQAVDKGPKDIVSRAFLSAVGAR